MRSPLGFVGALVMAATLAMPSPALAADCSRSSVGYAALPDLGAGTYKGEAGGLYGDGANDPPAAYAGAGWRAGSSVVPLDADGRPSANGRIVLLSIGMSNTTQEFSAFLSLAKEDPLRAPNVVTVDGAQGGQDARVWARADAAVWAVAEDRLRRAGVTVAQVQAVWLKQAVPGPRGDFTTTTRELTDLLAAIVRNAAMRYPSLRQVFVSPRTYAGYATTQLNPEPYAYESGFAVRALVARSIAAPDARPWVGWGPYLWTDGTKGRSDGLTWTCGDVAEDGTHPSQSGRRKVAEQLQRFFGTSPFAAWYRGGAAVPPEPTATAAPPPLPTATPNPSGAVAAVGTGTPGTGGGAVGGDERSELLPWLAGGVALLVLLLGGALMRRSRT